ncbi:MAG: hypothetical protein NC899_05875 [Candidatus Omnitrophica bacterium]|nr:hypothetical protein [Candidatus Omnitrophota bacterium]
MGGKINKKFIFKKNKFFIIPIFIVIILIFSFILLKINLIRNINLTERWAIKDIDFSTKEINLKDLTYKDTWLLVKIDQLKLKPSFLKNAFAFEGPGQVFSELEKKKLKIEGIIKGNIANGNLNITTSKIDIENIGNLKFYGNLSNWGKEKLEGIIEFNGINFKEVSEMTKYKLSLDGKIYGKIFIEKEKENIKEIKFNLEIRELSQQNFNFKFDIYLNGKYLPIEKKALLQEGIIKNQKGEKLIFSGFILQNEFELSFDTEEFSLDEFLKILPEEIIKKYKLKTEGAKLSTNNFILNYSKKKFNLMEVFFSCQNISISKI